MAVTESSAPGLAVPRVTPRTSTSPLIEIVVPVYNEAASLECSIRTLHAFLASGFPFDWQIVIADNGSHDGTWAIALRLRDQLDGVRAIRLDQKGRGGALRAAWSASRAYVVCYMDVDLSTDLRALLPLVAAIVSGHSEVAIGTRLGSGSKIVRSRNRELLSRGYNRLLRLLLRARFSDAQCGFKALRGDVARRLLPEIEDEGWFFDTELLIQAQRRGLRVHEVPVDWVEDPDSRVDIVPAILGDLRGTGRLLLASPLCRFMVIGVISTIAYAVLYLTFRAWLDAPAANAVALGITAVANTQANRHFTFGVRGRAGLLRQHGAGALVYVLGLGITEVSLRALQAVAPRAPHVAEAIVLVLAGAAATVTRYVILRTWVFARGRTGGGVMRPAPSHQ